MKKKRIHYYDVQSSFSGRLIKRFERIDAARRFAKSFPAHHVLICKFRRVTGKGPLPISLHFWEGRSFVGGTFGTI